MDYANRWGDAYYFLNKKHTNLWKERLVYKLILWLGSKLHIKG
jgi:hypothetical protein